MKTKILVYLADLVHNYFPGTYVVPLNIANIASYGKKVFGPDVVFELFKYPNELIAALKKNRPDVIGFSNYFWNADLNAQIGKYIKKAYPHAIIAMGGPLIRVDVEGIRKFLLYNSFVDMYIPFEGEKPFANFLSHRLRGVPWDEAVPEGCAYLSNAVLCYDHQNVQLDLSTLESPYLGGLLDKFLKERLVPLFETNRGCPFTCTFCTWGIASQKKIRQFSLERVFNELEYVAKINPEIPHWIFADANFGIFERDVEIAKKIANIKKENPCLRKIQLWMSKNTPARNSIISDLIDSSGQQLLAVQTLDPIVEKNIKRVNLDRSRIGKIISDNAKLRADVATDVLCGLPGESAQSHLETLRRCFDLGFSSIDVGNVYLLPGSEMESSTSRDMYGLKSQYRVRQGSYGVYRSVKSIESEEVVVATSTITRSEMLQFRLLHWLIWYGWNAQFLKPLICYMRDHYGIHPLDFLKSIADADKSLFHRVGNLFTSFHNNVNKEFFDTAESLKNYYMKSERFSKLLRFGSSKINFKYTGILLRNRSLFNEFCSFVEYVANKLVGDSYLKDYELFALLRNVTVSPDKLFIGGKLSKKKIRFKKCLLQYLNVGVENNVMKNNHSVEVLLYMSEEDMCFTKEMLKKYDYGKNRAYAVEKVLENRLTAFLNSIRIL